METQLIEMAETMGVDPSNLESWINSIRPYALDFIEQNSFAEMTPERMQEAIVYASQQVKNLYMELIENKTCRAKVANCYLSMLVWHDANSDGNSSKLAEEDVLENEDLIAEFGADNIRRSMNSLRKKGI